MAARATLRLAALMALAVTLLSLGAMVLQYRLVENRMMEAQRDLLTADLGGFAALYDQRRIIALRQAIEYRAAAATGEEMLLLQDRNGTVLAGTLTEWPKGLAPDGDGFAIDGAAEFDETDTRWLAAARELPGGFPLLVARSLQPVDDTLLALRRGILGLLAASLAAGGLFGWLSAFAMLAALTADLLILRPTAMYLNQLAQRFSKSSRAQPTFEGIPSRHGPRRHVSAIVGLAR